MENKIVNNAIILAAGSGLRMLPINSEVPKALVEINGVPLIERLINQLIEAGVEEIKIVVGYLKEELDYLRDKYQVSLVYNPYFLEKNNLYSLSLVSERISNTFILPCDIWCLDNPFLTNLEQSWYLFYQEQTDFKIDTDEDPFPFWDSMTGIAFISSQDAPALRQKLKLMSVDDRFNDSFWEEIIYNNKKFLISRRFVSTNSIRQIDTYLDLFNLDKDSNQLSSKAISAICHALGIQVSDISDISPLKKGMTNKSFLFSCRDKKYIMRIPGEGTDLLINRQEEASVYNVLASLNISDDIRYINPNTGYKITEFIENARVCDADNMDDVTACMFKLRTFHNLSLEVGHEFNIFSQIDFYEELYGGGDYTYSSYADVKQSIFALKDFIESNIERKVLTHIDAVPDNFLIIKKDAQLDIRLIDWEYSGMQDPHVDIAMFCIYALYDKEKIDQVIDIYFEGDVTEVIKMKIYAYIAACGLLWSNWCEYKKKLGVDFGDYAKAQYQYALDYSKIVLKYLNGASQIKE